MLTVAVHTWAWILALSNPVIAQHWNPPVSCVPKYQQLSNRNYITDSLSDYRIPCERQLLPCQVILYALPDSGGEATRALLDSVLSPRISISLRAHRRNDQNGVSIRTYGAL